MNHAGRRVRSGQQTNGIGMQGVPSLKKWGRLTFYLGVALAVSVGLVIPFLNGYPLHSHWVRLVLASRCCQWDCS